VVFEGGFAGGWSERVEKSKDENAWVANGYSGEALQRAQRAAPLRDFATATRLGEESGSKLPHSTESWRGCVWNAADRRRFRPCIRASL